LRRRALASKVRARVRSCTHTGCTQHPGAYRRSARPSSGWGEKRRRSEKERNKKKGGGNEEKRSGQQFITLSPAKAGAHNPRTIKEVRVLGSPLSRGRREVIPLRCLTS